VTLLVDYYGIHKDWPGYEQSKRCKEHTQKFSTINQATSAEIQRLFPEQNKGHRFIPYVSMHEIEALYFSDPPCLSEELGVDESEIDMILKKFGEPESINDHPHTAPSKRLEALSQGRDFKKTTTGLAIAEKIGIKKMRERCSLFDSWLMNMERLLF
jgi:hypothetical protein